MSPSLLYYLDLVARTVSLTIGGDERGHARKNQGQDLEQGLPVFPCRQNQQDDTHT